MWNNNVLIGVGIATVIGMTGYAVNDYITLKGANRHQEKIIARLEHHRQETEKVMYQVEKDTNHNLTHRQKSLESLSSDGCFNGDNGRNPEWMREYEIKANSP